jgi:5-methylcytosine-specific restriction endonuclease McrA
MSSLTGFSHRDLFRITKIQSIFRMYYIKKIIEHIRGEEHRMENNNKEQIYSVGDDVLVNNGSGLIRRTITTVNNISECVAVADDPTIYSFSAIKPCYFDVNYMNFKCSKPLRSYNIRQGKGSFYGVKITVDNDYYICMKLDKQLCFGPFDDMNHALLYHDWIKFNWLITSNLWLKNNKKQYTNFGYIVSLINNGKADQKTIDMFNEFKIYFGGRLDLSDPEVKPEKEKPKVKKQRKKRKMPVKISKRGKSDKIHCFVKPTPNRSREPQLSLNGHREVLKIQDGKCGLCHEKIEVEKWNWEIDHCIPWSLNGGHCIGNFQAVHKKCHDIKTKYIDKMFKDFNYQYVEYKDAKGYCKALFDNYLDEMKKKQKEFLSSYRADF